MRETPAQKRVREELAKQGTKAFIGAQAKTARNIAYTDNNIEIVSDKLVPGRSSNYVQKVVLKRKDMENQ